MWNVESEGTNMENEHGRGTTAVDHGTEQYGMGCAGTLLRPPGQDGAENSQGRERRWMVAPLDRCRATEASRRIPTTRFSSNAIHGRIL
jgi:hypothetical protein